MDACKARLKKAKAAEAKATVGVLLALCPLALVGAKEELKGPGVRHGLPPLPRPCLERPGWGGAAPGRLLQAAPLCPHPQRDPGGPDLWGPGY